MSKELTQLEQVEQLQAGDWLFFNPSIYDNGAHYVKVTGVRHNDDMLVFTYRILSAEPDETDNIYSEMREYVEANGVLPGVYIRKLTEGDVINHLVRCIDNVGVNAWDTIKAL